MQRIIMQSYKGKVNYIVQTRFKLFGLIPLWWETDIIDEVFYSYKASFSTLKEAEDYISQCYKHKIGKIL